MDNATFGLDLISGATRLVVALAVGLLIGMEREWRLRQGENKPVERAGLRTFGLIGLLGGLAGLLQPNTGGGWLVPGMLIALAVLLVTQRHKEDVTTLVGALVTALLGTLATSGMPQLAAASAVVVVVLLNLKPTLHRWVAALSELELRAVLRLLVISLVILPVLPDQGYGPYQALNPRTIWWFVVLISTLSFVGYLAIRILGPRRGYLATGFFGGLVSSTATTAALARLGRSDPADALPLATGIALANGVMAVRMVVITAAIDPDLARAAAWPFGCAAAAALIFAFFLWRISRKQKTTEALQIDNPFDLGPALRLAAVLAAILVLARFLEDRYGQSGLQVLAAIAGLVDVDAITLTVARGTAEGHPLAPAVIALMIAAFANAIFKGVLLVSAGGRLAGWGIAVLVVMSAAGAVAWLLPVPWTP